MRRRCAAAVGVAVAIASGASIACGVQPDPFPTIENRMVDGPESSGLVIGYPNSPITERTLAEFLSWRFARQLSEGTFEAGYNDTQDDVIDELTTMGIHTIHDLAAIVPADFEARGAGEFILEDPANIPGLVRDFMMIHDADRYFSHAWKNRWQSILPANVSALRAYVHDFTPFYDAGVLTHQEVEDAPVVGPGRPSHRPPPVYGRTAAPW